MHQFVRLITALLAVSVLGCWSQHRRSRTSVSGESYLQPLVANSPSASVKFDRNNVEHSRDSATPRDEIHPKQLLVQPLLLHNFEKIGSGMQRGEVEKLLGGAPGHYGRNLGVPVMTCEAGLQSPEIWTDDTNMLEIEFDEHDLVIRTHKRAGYSRLP
jgi:hypothetical protein